MQLKIITIFIISLQLTIFNTVNAQIDKRGNNVIVGEGGTYASFTNDTTKPLTAQYYPTTSFPHFPYRFYQGSSCISDSASGRMLLLCNGATVYDTIGNIIENGDSLVPNGMYTYNPFPASGNTQGSIILPKGNNNQYYIFTPTISDSILNYMLSSQVGSWSDLIQYHIVDINANGGAGKVIKKNIPLMQNAILAQVGMQACRHANGVDWWLLKNGATDSNTIYRFLVKPDTIEGPYVQHFSKPHFYQHKLNFSGQSAFSKTGKKYAVAVGRTQSLFIADFDRCTGFLSNPITIPIPTDSTTDPFYDNAGVFDSIIAGVAFSANDSFIYVSKSYNMYQCDLYDSSNNKWYLIQHGSDTSFLWFEEYKQLHRGLDDRLYIGKRSGISNSLSVIDYPNKKGIACGFCRKCLRYDQGLYSITCPANVPDFTLGADSSCYWPLSNFELGILNFEWKIYPNPSNGNFVIEVSEKLIGKTIQIFDITGKEILQIKAKQKNYLQLANYSSGVYFVKVGNEVKRLILE